MIKRFRGWLKPDFKLSDLWPFVVALVIFIVMDVTVYTCSDAGASTAELDQEVAYGWTATSSDMVRMGERFTAWPACTITSIDLKLYKSASPTGTFYIRVRNCADDSIMGTLDEMDVSLLTTTQTWYTFDATPVVVPDFMDIYIMLEYDGDDTNHIHMMFEDTESIYPYGYMRIWREATSDYYNPAWDWVWRNLRYTDLPEGYGCPTPAPTCPPTPSPAPTCPPTPSPAPTATPCPTCAPESTPTPTPTSDYFGSCGIDNFAGEKTDVGYTFYWCIAEEYLGNDTGTWIRGSWADYPVDYTDGFLVYDEGNSTDYQEFTWIAKDTLDYLYLSYGLKIGNIYSNEVCTYKIGGEAMEAFTEVFSKGIQQVLLLVLCLALSGLALKTNAFVWFVVSFAWLGLAYISADSMWIGIVCGVMALLCQVLFILSATARKSRR